MTTPSRLRALPGGGEGRTAPMGRLRVVPDTGPSRPMTESTLLTIGCHHVDGTPASFADVVRAVYAGDADPADYAIAFDARRVHRATKT